MKQIRKQQLAGKELLEFIEKKELAAVSQDSIAFLSGYKLYQNDGYVYLDLEAFYSAKNLATYGFP